MRIDAIATVNEMQIEKVNGKTVVIIDVLRSSSTIIAAFMAGAAHVIPAETVGKAFHLHTESTYLAGERFCKKINGFHFSNSPTEILSHDLKGKDMILTTTNGTKAMQKAEGAHVLLIGSFLNGSEVAKKAIQLGNDLTLYCAGSRGHFALEDGLAAGYMIRQILSLAEEPIELNDFTRLLHDGYVQNEKRIEEILFQTETGKRLSHLDLHEDIRFSAQRDLTSILPQMNQGRIFVQQESYVASR